jgi:ABC-type transport system involved in cytochrome c biogenesis permease component
MSTAATSAVTPPAHGFDSALVARQLTGILRLELGKNLLGRRALAMYFLAFFPLPLALFWALWPGAGEGLAGPSAAAALFASVFPGYIAIPLYLSALLLFMSLFRSEIMEKSLHYYLLTPVRREVLVAGKYVSALIAMTITFVIGTSSLYLLTMSPWGFGEMSQYLFRGPGLSNLFAYLSIVVLGCAGYGAVFLLTGLLFKNPIVPAAVFWGWEFINFLLPSVLKKISVVHYLRSLFPIPVSEGPFAIIADPTPIWVAVPGILIFTALVLVLAGWKARRMEISYGDD